jgi:hypothetical protein
MQIARMVWARSSLLLALLGSGCAHAPSAIAPFIDQGRANVLAATAELRGKSLAVKGVVMSTGLRTIEQYRARRDYANLLSDVTVRRESIGVPYVMARDAGARDDAGAVLCYFAPEALAQVARIRPDTTVVMTGEFQDYGAQGSLLVLTACELD